MSTQVLGGRERERNRWVQYYQSLSFLLATNWESSDLLHKTKLSYSISLVYSLVRVRARR